VNIHRSALIAAAAPSAALAWWLWDLQQRAPAPEELDIFGRLFVFHDAPAAWLCLPILAVACVLPLQRLALRIARAFGERPNLVAAASFVGFALVARFVHRGHPLSLDEYAPVFQSELFAHGRLFAALPLPLLDFLLPRDMQQFFFSASRESGAVASGYWPGFALLLTPFTALGVPWLLNPLIGAVTLRLLHRVALSTFGARELAGLAVLIALGSAALTINAGSFYAMPAHALANLAYAALLAAPTPARALAAGLCGGLALALHNPFPHALFAAPWIAWLGLRPDRARVLPALALGYAPLVLLLGVGWSALLQSELGSSWGSAARATELSAFFELPNAAIVAARIVGFAKLWLWAAPASLVVALLGLRSARRDVPLALWAASAALTALAYFFVPFDQGHGWGYRYFHSAWLAIPLLAVAAIRAQRELAGFAAACALGGLAVLTPLRAAQTHDFVASHLAQLPSAERGIPELLLVDTSAGYYSIDLVQNDALLARRPLVMESLGEAANAQMRRRHFPELVLLAKDERGEVWGRR